MLEEYKADVARISGPEMNIVTAVERVRGAELNAQRYRADRAEAERSAEVAHAAAIQLVKERDAAREEVARYKAVIEEVSSGSAIVAALIRGALERRSC